MSIEDLDQEIQSVNEAVENICEEYDDNNDTGFVKETDYGAQETMDYGDDLHDLIVRITTDKFPELMTVSTDLFENKFNEKNEKHMSQVDSIFGVKERRKVL